MTSKHGRRPPPPPPRARTRSTFDGFPCLVVLLLAIAAAAVLMACFGLALT